VDLVLTLATVGLGITALIVPIIGGLWLLTLLMGAVDARNRMSARDAEGFSRSLAAMEGRMKSLEAILDSEAPGWRKRHEAGEG
jgi:hypothetical protein